MDAEDEEFNRVERESRIRKEAVLQALHNENERLGLYKDAYEEQPSRAQLMAEVTVLIELVRVLNNKVVELEKKMIEEDDDIQDYKQPWVNLTNQQIIELWHGTPTEQEWIDRVWSFARAIESQLKKENT